MAKNKTPDYVLRAQRNYAKKFEHASCNLPLGTKERIKAVTDESVNVFINRLVLAELERLENQ